MTGSVLRQYIAGQWVPVAAGARGYTGSAGEGGGGTGVGYTGSQGIQGYTGSQGLPGIDGAQGQIGYTGSQGVQGPIGYTGSAGTGGGASALDDLTDVTITSVTLNQVLTYDGSKWINKNVINDSTSTTSTVYSSSYIDSQLGSISTALTAILGV